jgi:hypothetical protein
MLFLELTILKPMRLHSGAAEAPLGAMETCNADAKKAYTGTLKAHT